MRKMQLYTVPHMRSAHVNSAFMNTYAQIDMAQIGIRICALDLCRRWHYCSDEQ